jgi:hypothetical protein
LYIAANNWFPFHLLDDPRTAVSIAADSLAFELIDESLMIPDT